MLSVKVAFELATDLKTTQLSLGVLRNSYAVHCNVVAQPLLQLF